MKTLLLSLSALLMSLGLSAQIKVPQPSPSATHEQVVGLTKVTLHYSRPGMRGRTIFGNLVPFNEKWRTGANNNTTISFDTDVQIDGKKLSAGTYSLYTVPQEKQWQVIFYKDTTNWGLPQAWDGSKIALSATASAHQLPINIESFTISVDDLSNDSANLYLLWEKTAVILPFKVPTDDIAMASIAAVMKANPTANDYFAAATYYHDTEKNLEKAYEWIEKSVEMQEAPFYVLRKKSLIEADLGMKEKAIATARRSLAAAEKAGNQDYVKMNRDSLNEWGAE